MIAVVEPAKVSPPAKPTPKVNPIETLQKTVSASRLNTSLQRLALPTSFSDLCHVFTGITQILTRKCWVGALALPQGRDEK